MSAAALRRAAILVLAAALAAPAFAQTPPPADATKPAPAPNPALDAAKAAADAMGLPAMADIQRDLIWTGDLNSLATGEFGKRSFEAIKAFQKRIGAPQTGILLPAEREKLDAAAEAAARPYGFRTITTQGVTLAYPAKLATKKTATPHGFKYASDSGNVTVDILRYDAQEETFEAIFARLKAERTGRKVSYSLMKPDFFVIAGTVDGKSFYMRFLKAEADTRGFVLGWDPALSPGFDRIGIVMAGSLAMEGAAPLTPVTGPVAASAPAPAAPPPAPAVPAGPPIPLPPGAPATPRSGVGFAVSVDGAVLASADLVAGCTRVALGDGTSGTVAAGDAAAGLALVRLTGRAPAASVALSTAAPAPDAALRRLAAAGSGEARVAALEGPGGDTRRLTLAAPGAGGLFDAQGALVAFAPHESEATALKALFVSAFLRSRGVTPAAQGGDPAAAAVALTCTPAKG